LAEIEKGYIVSGRTMNLYGSSYMDLIVTVKEIKGRCPVYSAGDSIVIRDGYILDTNNSANTCMHSLASIMPYYIALSKGVTPENLGLSGEKEGSAYIQCLDPCEITGGGTVVFEITPHSA
jgi:uncharacterized repeat protein (TIGR04076 family)